MFGKTTQHVTLRETQDDVMTLNLNSGLIFNDLTGERAKSFCLFLVFRLPSEG